MTVHATSSPKAANRSSRPRLIGELIRYVTATLGPLSVSVAHFVASLLLLRGLADHEFGLFAFVLVVVQLCFGLSNALLGTPYTVRSNQGAEDCQEQDMFFKANMLLAGAGGLVCGGIALALAAGSAAALFGAYGLLATLRWFLRSVDYARHRPGRVVLSDIVYALVLLGGLAVASVEGLSLHAAIAAFLIAACLGLLANGAGLYRQIRAFRYGSLASYPSIWRDQSRWALLGVVTTEATANAHAWLVTLIAGPAAFAPIAAAGLFLRPISLCVTSLTQLERPAMARAIADSDIPGALRMGARFRLAVVLVWGATCIVGFSILIRWPSLILKPAYDPGEVVIAAAALAGTALLGGWRTPDSVLLQAANRFKPLAIASLVSGIASILGVALLLAVAAPVWSVVGLLAGQAVLAWRVGALLAAWRQAHG